MHYDNFYVAAKLQTWSRFCEAAYYSSSLSARYYVRFVIT